MIVKGKRIFFDLDIMIGTCITSRRLEFDLLPSTHTNFMLKFLRRVYIHRVFCH
jgi:hypothetical protein